MKALLKVGADPNIQDEAGNTALHLAALARPCPPVLAQTLVEHGAHLVCNTSVLRCKMISQFANLSN